MEDIYNSIVLDWVINTNLNNGEDLNTLLENVPLVVYEVEKRLGVDRGELRLFLNTYGVIESSALEDIIFHKNTTNIVILMEQVKAFKEYYNVWQTTH